jgi:HTH-type transcriptional regulator/antitoxin MqsA
MVKTPPPNRLTVCPECDGPLEISVRPRTMEYRGQSRVYDQPGQWCDTCGEVYMNDEDQDVYDRVLAELKAEVEDVLAPAEVARIRTKLKLSQRRAGRLLGGGTHAFYKYEKGEAMVSDAMANLLRLLDRKPEMLKVLFKTTGRGGRIKAAFDIGDNRLRRRITPRPLASRHARRP